MKTITLHFYALTLLFCASITMFGGCNTACSLHPLYTGDDLIYDETLLGMWASEPNEPDDYILLTHLDKPEPNTYELTYVFNDARGVFHAKMLKIGQSRYLDIMPATFPFGVEDVKNAPRALNSFHFMPLHTFAKIESVEPVLVIRVIDGDKMKDLLKEHPDAVAHTIVDDDKLILTAEPEQLQVFILKFKKDERLFPGEIELRRVTSDAMGRTERSSQEGHPGSGN